MYAIAVLDSDALATFRAECPWLNFPRDICEVSVYFNDNDEPIRLTALTQGPSGETRPADVDAFGVDAVLALIRYTPHGTRISQTCPLEDRVWRMLESLPVAFGPADVAKVEKLRADQLEEAYQIVRQIALETFEKHAAAEPGSVVSKRVETCIAAIPASLREVEENHKPIFLEIDLWRMVAVLRDELTLPADYELSLREMTFGLAFGDMDEAFTEPPTMSDPVVQALFDLSPVAFSISSIGEKCSRYVRVNQAYLDLVGKTWPELRGSEMVSSGVVLQSEGRHHRLMRLDSEGGYAGEPAEIRHGSGELIPVVISARRVSVAGRLYDFEVLVPDRTK